MREVIPSTHLIAGTEIYPDAQAQMLAALGAPDDWQTDAETDGEELVEVMGRLCYKSFGTDMNPNLTRVREGNANYIGNILNTKHGSVIEHATATIGFVDVSPVVTHELVRHRQGTAFSQVSMRFVRLTEIGFYMPQAFGSEFIGQLYDAIPDDAWAEMAHGYRDQPRQAHADAAAETIQLEVRELVEHMERFQRRLAKIGGLDALNADFNLKKRFTSSMRRLAPYGLATAIGVTANHRAWRFMIAQRTHRSAEEEIRLAFGQVATKLANRFPALYQDMSVEHVEGFDEFTFRNHKV